MTDLESARELERLMRAYGGDVLRLCYVCLRDEGHKKGGCERATSLFPPSVSHTRQRRRARPPPAGRSHRGRGPGRRRPDVRPPLRV